MGASAALGAVKAVGEDLLGQVGTAVKEAVPYWFRSPEAVLKGMQYGDLAVNTIRQQRETQGMIAGDAVNELKNTFKDKDVAARDSVRSFLKTGATTNPVAAQVGNDVRTTQNRLLTEVNARKVASNQQPIIPDPQFFPVIPKDAVYRSGSTMQKELVDHLVTTGQAPDVATATQRVQRLAGAVNGQKAIDFMHDPGFTAPDKFFEQDPQYVFSKYAEAASRHIASSDFFGYKNSNLKSIADIIGTANGLSAKEYVENLFDSATFGSFNRNYYQGHVNAERLIKEFEGFTKLGRIGLAEPLQAMNTLLMTNASSMFKSLDDVIKDGAKAKEFALQSGAVLTETMQQIKNAANGIPLDEPVNALFHYTGFSMERRLNMTLASNAGKHYAIELAGKLRQNPTSDETRLALKTIGLDADEILQQGLTQQHMLTAGRRVAESTQYMNSPLDTPLAWHKSPTMRVLSLYKSFAFNQGRFLIDQLAQSYKLGKYENYAYFGLLFPAVGEILGDVESLSRGQSPSDRPQDKLARLSDDYARVAGFGVFTGIVGALNRRNLLEYAAGPVLSDAAGAIQGLWNLGTTHTLSRPDKLTNQIPVVGPFVSNKFVKSEKQLDKEQKARENKNK